MVEGYGKALRRILSEEGWTLRRQGKGDHEIWWHPPSGRRVTLDRGVRSRNAALRILKQAGVKADI
jgi:predicted RNA binding protein YcfA (HicA-like mRNA interferase family)